MGCCSSSGGFACGSAKAVETKYKGTTQPEDPKQDARRRNAEYIDTLQTLAKVPLLKRLPKDQHPQLAANCVVKEYPPGQIVIKEGDVGNEFFVIRQGNATVKKKNEKGDLVQVAVVQAGDYFGENALLLDEPRNATIQAETKLVTLKISREKFEELGLHELLEFPKRQAVCCGVELGAPTGIHPRKLDKDRNFIVDNLLMNEHLKTLGIEKVDREQVGLLADSATLQDIAKGEEVIKQGDTLAEFFYVVITGKFEVFISEANEAGDAASSEEDEARRESKDSASQKKVMTIKPGGSFGELALMYNVPRAATVKATMASSVWVIDRGNFKRTLMKASDDQVEEYEKLLQNVGVFSSLHKNEIRAVAEALTEMSFIKDEVVVEQGQQGDTFYILKEGEVAVIKDGDEKSRFKATYHFGERALIENEPRAATIQVTSPIAKALALDKPRFDLLLGSVRDLMKEKDGGGTRPSGRLSVASVGHKMFNERKHVEMEEEVTMQDLEPVGILGVGAFGKVELREHKRTGKTYAVKMMSKGYIAKMRMQNNVVNEKHILASVSSQFIIRLYNTSKCKQWLYFYMEPALGGELYVVYHRKCFHGSLTHAKYYCASVIMAFEHLHERHVIYRDLKPENLLLTQEGWLKLTDMGLAKFAIGKTYTTCGTPEYFAPEVIRSTGQTRAVDWWTLGILIFELMTGSAPFRAENDMAMYGKVLKGIGSVTFPKMDTATQDIIKDILKTEPSERLPMRKGGLSNLKAHTWFNGFSWDGLVDRSIKPPYEPAVKSKTDLRNFCHVKVHKANWIEWKDDGSGWDEDF